MEEKVIHLHGAISQFPFDFMSMKLFSKGTFLKLTYYI